MREFVSELQTIISSRSLPDDFMAIFDRAWNQNENRFTVQETFVLDYKETVPNSFSDPFGSSIIKLALSFFNTYGGVIVFGVKDKTLEVVGLNSLFDIESFNRVLSDCTGLSIECHTKTYSIPAQDELRIAVALVPKRRVEAPARVLKRICGFAPGELFIRERHECLYAAPRHIPVLYSCRENVPDSQNALELFPVHRSLPPSPATMKDFVQRGHLMEDLWNWLVLSDRPRLYLHGPGGSGKSTLAFEFAKLLSEHGHSIRFANGEKFDYIIFISGKETELNVHSFKQQRFALRQFQSAEEQFDQILFHSGLLDVDRIGVGTKEDRDVLIDQLLMNYNGLIVIDDIDALSRRKVDTGEEGLFLRCVKSGKRNKILYTLRNAPAHALGSAIAVPGLSEDSELFEFLQLCCEEFQVPPPSGEHIPTLQAETASLPLLIETVIGIRKFTSNYQQALQTFKEKGGDEARRYLYQREYDNLSSSGKSRYVLATLLLLEDPISSESLCNFTQFSSDVVAEALSETASVFLSAFEASSGETLFQLSPPAVGFIRSVSEHLSFIAALTKRVGYLKREGAKDNPRDATLILNMRSFLIQGNYERVESLLSGFSKDDPILVNPKVSALLGQALSELGPSRREDARAAFKLAESMSFKDPFMMRSWFNMEFNSGYSLQEAKRICQSALSDTRLGPRYIAEFLSKLGACYFQEANFVGSASREKSLNLLRASIVSYCEALWTGKELKTIDLKQTVGWAERPLARFVQIVGFDTDEFFRLLEELSEKKHDVQIDGADALINAIYSLPRSDDSNYKNRIKGFTTRTMGKISKNIRRLDGYPGFHKLVSTLGELKNWAEQK